MILDAAVDVALKFDDGATASYTNVGSNIAQLGGADGEPDIGKSAAQFDNFPAISLNVNVTSIDTTTGDETYVATVEWAANDTFGTITHTSPALTLVAGPNVQVTTVLDRFARVDYVLAGTTPILVVEQGYFSSYSQ